MQVELRVGAAFASAHPDDAARVLEGLNPPDATAFLAAVAPERAAQVMERMVPPSAVSCLNTLEPDTAAAVVAALPVNVAARLLRLVPDAAAVLRALPEPVAEAVAGLLRFPEGTAGALADPHVLAVPDDISAGDARKHVRRTPARVAPHLYVLDRSDHLVGVLDLSALMAAPAADPLTSLMRRDPPTVSARADLSTLTADPAWLEYDAVAVVDASGIFQGVIRHRTLRHLAKQSGGGAGGFTPLVGLAELYWTGFSRVLFGLGPEETETASDTATDQESGDDT